MGVREKDERDSWSEESNLVVGCVLPGKANYYG